MAEEFTIDHKALEAVVIKKNFFYKDNIRAIDLVRKFVKERKRILYGGTAIDFALRVKGDKIYPDEFLAFPDLDFYSPDSVGDAYDLADVENEEGVPNISAIVAYHTQTMRVRFNTISVADISYAPRSVYEKMHTIEYDGFRVIHPWHQYIDMHLGMARPFNNAPREVILDRRNKDVERFNKLYPHYPVEVPEGLEWRRAEIAIEVVPDNALLIGLAAFPLYLQIAAEMGGLPIPQGMPRIEFKDGVTAKTIGATIQLDWAGELPQFTYYKEITEFDVPNRTSYMDMFPHSLETDGAQVFLSENQRYHAFRCGRWIGASAQHSLAFLMFQYFVTGNESFLRYYKALLELTIVASRWTIERGDKKLIEFSPFIIPMQYWPSEAAKNISSALDISLRSSLIAIGIYRGEPIVKPMAYYPGSGKNRPAPFQYKDSRYFDMGYELTTKRIKVTEDDEEAGRKNEK